MPALKLPASILHGDHFVAFKTSLSNILLTNRAEDTYAQIIDGMPTADVWDEYANRRHEWIENHKQLCPTTREKTKAFQANFSPDELHLDTSALQAYQNTQIGSRPFLLRLIELTAIACHEIAVFLFRNVDGGRHKGCETWKPKPILIWPYGASEPVAQPVPEPPPTVFFHRSYQDHDQYPNGVADMVGYWAESRLFGGVVLFDRGPEDVDARDIFIHPYEPHRLIFQLSEAQIQQFADFVIPLSLSLSQRPVPPFPFKAERQTRRVDPWDAMATLHIFRNRYERKLPARRVYNCVLTPEDYPEIEDQTKTIRERFI
ncbi:hypothetical protein FQN55_005814 [Onygenales sp. PD_40]|nr:hypothetical protein FQN55_005814 [Onygenales sp. PD_40]